MILWGHSGICIVLNEEMLKVQVLGRKGPLRVFQSENTKSLISQLNLYGFPLYCPSCTSSSPQAHAGDGLAP